jgi:hypothetical protein
MAAVGNDQTSARIRIKNTGSGGGDYAWIAGVNNVGNDGFSLLDITNGATRMIIKSNGIINFSNVPSSSAGLSSGDIYKDGSGFLKIV